jgi:NAD(P)-dependent dehydrogenase (short-subunit alcohol dehydrogenase family)
MLLKDKVVMVSGIGPGLGLDTARAMAREGAHLVIGARTRSRLDELGAELEASGTRVALAATDITDDDSCAALAAEAKRVFGRVDVLVNNAYHAGTYETVEDTDLETWRAPFEVNVLGSLRLSKAVIPLMKEQGGGSIVMVCSMSMRRIMSAFGGYSASKAALANATQTLAVELGSYNIRVNSVVPGYIWGPALEGYFKQQAEAAGVTAEKVYDGVAAETALGHIPTGAEIAETVVFFASEMSKVITGQSLDVNGGHFFW